MSAPLRSLTRSIVIGLLDTTPFELGLRLLEQADRGRAGVFGVLTYHRVGDPQAMRGHPGLVSATPTQFAEQMEYLSNRFRPVSLTELLAARAGGPALPPRAVMVTFDDAYRDFAEHAWPILRRFGMPATLFVPTDFPGRPSLPFWWDWLHESIVTAPAGAKVAAPAGTVVLGEPEARLALIRELRADLKREPHATVLGAVAEIGDQLGCPPPAGQVLAWDELRSLAADGVSLAPHSRTHALLDRTTPAVLEDELCGSFADLEREIGEAPPALAYPSGSVSAAVLSAADAAGYVVAFTTRRGLNQLGSTDWLALRRINVGRSTSINVLRAQLGRWAVAWS